MRYIFYSSGLHQQTFRRNLALIKLNLNKNSRLAPAPKPMSKRSVADLKPGERATIQSFNDQLMSLKLLEMGCLPGAEVCLHCKAPLGDPICLNVSGYCLSMRRSEAATILIEN